MSKSDNHVNDILLQNWEIIQNQISRSSAIRWTVRGGVVAAWWASLLFDLQTKNVEVYILILTIIVSAFIYEVELKLWEEKLIHKSKKIEKSLNAIAHGDFDIIYEFGISISSNVSRELNISAWRSIFHLWRWKFWAPYIILFFFTIAWGMIRHKS